MVEEGTHLSSLVIVVALALFLLAAVPRLPFYPPALTAPLLLPVAVLVPQAEEAERDPAALERARAGHDPAQRRRRTARRLLVAERGRSPGGDRCEVRMEVGAGGEEEQGGEDQEDGGRLVVREEADRPVEGEAEWVEGRVGADAEKKVEEDVLRC